MTKKLRAYMVHGGEPIEGSVLVFAHTVQQAKVLGYPDISGWGLVDEFIQVRARWLRNSPWVFDEANKDKLAANTPHVIACPTTCKDCGLWGLQLNDDEYCEDCEEER